MWIPPLRRWKTQPSGRDALARGKELIAIGIAVATNNEAALEWLVKQALDHGADRAQIEDAIGVGAAMGGSAETRAGARLPKRCWTFYS